jgi:hypothetical protein
MLGEEGGLRQSFLDCGLRLTGCLRDMRRCDPAGPKPSKGVGKLPPLFDSDRWRRSKPDVSNTEGIDPGCESQAVHAALEKQRRGVG